MAYRARSPPRQSQPAYAYNGVGSGPYANNATQLQMPQVRPLPAASPAQQVSRPSIGNPYMAASTGLNGVVSNAPSLAPNQAAAQAQLAGQRVDRVAMSTVPVPVHRAQDGQLSAPVVRQSPVQVHRSDVATAEQWDHPPDAEFMRLLDSLEMRVDLMAQMQHTRNQIQAQTRNADDQPGAMVQMVDGQTVDAYGAPIPVQDQHREFQFDGLKAGRVGSYAAPAAISNHDQHSEIGRLMQENAQLHDMVDELKFENDQLRQQLAGFGLPGGAEELRNQLHTLLDTVRANDEEAHRRREEHEQNLRDWHAERETLYAEIERLRNPGRSASQDPFGRTGSLRSSAEVAVSSLPTRPVLPIEQQSTFLEPIVAPFNKQMCGVNVSLSEDGYLATRTRGCRQSVLIGSGPLPQQNLGWYFEVEVRETVEGWVGGLGIGVTRTEPQSLRRVPDKAWRMPHTWVVGYWGCVFIDGKELRTKWQVDALPAGTKVGLLASNDGSGDLRIFAGGDVVVYAEGALRGHAEPDTKFYPVVDVFSATLSVALSPQAAPPQPPWTSVESSAVLTPPGSPMGSVASMPRSMFSTERRDSERDADVLAVMHRHSIT